MAAKKEQKKSNPVIRNRKAEFEYHLLKKFTAGIVLTGTEVKALRDGKAQMLDAYCRFEKKELWVIKLHISPYESGTYNNHDPQRSRKLLLTKPELRQLYSKIGNREERLTIIPVKIFFNDRNFAKMEIALAQGKKLYDKRESIKEREVSRMKSRGNYDD